MVPSATWVASPAHADGGGWGNKEYKVSEVAKPAPAGTFAAGAGGDGWGISVYDGKVYNIYHNTKNVLTLDCHNRTDGRPCWNTGDIKLLSGWTDVSYPIQNNANSGTNTPNTLLPAYGPGQWIDPTTGILYAYTVNLTGTTYTPGIVKVDTKKIDPTHLLNGASTFIPMAQNTVACANSVGANCLTPTIQLNRKVFAVNFVTSSASAGTSNDANKLMCYNVDLASPCSSSPLTLPDAVSGTKYNVAQIGTFGDNLLIPLTTGTGGAKLECINTKTEAPCVGWITPTDTAYSGYGGAFPILDSNGNTTGVCIPDKLIVCYNMLGASISVPTGLTSVMWNNSTAFSGSRNGSALVIGTRVFVPSTGDNKIHCADWSVAGLSCGAGFPFNAATAGASSVYTVGSDANDPTCVWLNSDSGTANYTFVPNTGTASITIAKVGQIQSFDAYTGGRCGSNGSRVMLANLLAPGTLCAPRSYTSLKLTTPVDNITSGLSGTVDFLNPAGTQLYDTSTPTALPVDSATIQSDGTVTLPVNLGQTGGVIPTLLIKMNYNGSAYGKDIGIEVIFVGSADPVCAPPGYSAAPYTVSFDVNGATLANTSPLVETVTQDAALNTAVITTDAAWNTPTGVTNGVPNVTSSWLITSPWSAAFLGWFDSPSGGAPLNEANLIHGNTTYYAHWQLPTYLVTFDANGGVALSPNTESITVGSDLSGGALNVGAALPAPTWVDATKVFVGWYDTDTAGSLISETTVPAHDSTYYAHWITAPAVITVAASAITKSSATLNGTINTVTPDAAFFCFDDVVFDASTVTVSPDTCNNAILEPLTVQTAPGTYSYNVTGLTASTTYYFMQVGLLSGNVIAGNVLSFTTSADTPPAPPAPVAPVLLTPTITWPNPGNQTGPYNLSANELNATCSVPGSVMSYSPSLNTLLQPGNYRISVTCTPPAGSGYGPLTATVPFTVVKPVGTITWTTPSPVEGPATLGASELNALCSIPGATLTYTPALGNVEAVGTRTLQVICTPPAGSAYDPISTTVQLIVTPKPKPVAPVITIDPPVNPTAGIVSGTSSTVAWEKSPNALGYFITVDGTRVCTTYMLSCTFNKLVGPNSDIKIYAIKGALTSSYVTPVIVKSSKPQVIGVVYFDTAKYNIRPDQQAEINRVAGLLKSLGYTDIVIGGHTDSNAYDNQTLSNNRAKLTKSALSKLVSGLSVDLHYSGATQPMASNSTISGQAKNRRAEISVW